MVPLKHETTSVGLVGADDNFFRRRYEGKIHRHPARRNARPDLFEPRALRPEGASAKCQGL